MQVLLCAIAKFENNYIREWVQHHKNIGFSKIVLYDNNDFDGERFQDVINDYIESGFVIIEDVRGVEYAQIDSYIKCYNKYKNAYDWMAFWDIDEFMELERYSNVQEFINSLSDYQCIRLCWKQYTDSNLIKLNGNYSRKRFTEVLDKEWCIKNKTSLNAYWMSSRQTKSIVKCNIDNFTITSPHVFLNVPSCDALGRPCSNSSVMIGTPVWTNAWLNHYRFRTLEEYLTKKMVRLWPTKYGNGGKDKLTLEFFFQFNKNTIEKQQFIKEFYDLENKLLVNSFVFSYNGEVKPNNWGDELNFNFLPLITKQQLIHNNLNIDCTNYSLIGSIITDYYINNKTIIWGSGIQKKTILKNKPMKVCAVRGPITRNFLINNGIDCPAIYGDPALLLPLYYYPEVPKKYELGIIPHWQSSDDPILNNFKKSGVKIIDLHDYKDWKTVIQDILMCKRIASESLHGLIVSEAYKIPNLWIDLNLMGKYDIKFHDFFLSINCDRNSSYQIGESTSIETLIQECDNSYKEGTMVDLNALIESCPFELLKPDENKLLN